MIVSIRDDSLLRWLLGLGPPPLPLPEIKFDQKLSPTKLRAPHSLPRPRTSSRSKPFNPSASKEPVMFFPMKDLVSFH